MGAPLQDLVAALSATLTENAPKAPLPNFAGICLARGRMFACHCEPGRAMFGLAIDRQ
jgi:hypothetical protein